MFRHWEIRQIGSVQPREYPTCTPILPSHLKILSCTVDNCVNCQSIPSCTSRKQELKMAERLLSSKIEHGSKPTEATPD